MTEYKIRIYSAGYVFRYELADYLWLKCEREVNSPGLLQVDLLASHPGLASLEYRGIVELWRRVAGGNLSNPQQGIGWTRESVHLYLGKTISNKGYDVVRLYCPGALWLLSTRVIAWAEEVAGKTVWADRVDAIGRGLVLANAGSGATVAAGRLREGAITGLAVETVTAAGESVTWVTGWGDLLAELQSLAAGRSALARRKIKENLSFKVRQMPGVVYGRDYFLGDKVKAKYLDHELTPKVAAVVLEHERMGADRVEVICRV